MRWSNLLLFALAGAVGGCDRDPTVPENMRTASAPQLAVVGPARQVSLGEATACVLGADARVFCWGSDYFGTASPPQDLGSVTQISLGGAHACAVKSDARVVCWGSDVYGESSVPADLVNVKQVSAGRVHTCALKTDGTVSCWGPSWASVDVPAGLGNVTQVSAGSIATCALKQDGTVVCWGPYDDLVSGATVLQSVVQVSAGADHACALKLDGTVTCVGSDEFGQATVPEALGSVIEVSAGGYHTCAVKTDGTVSCWGQSAGIDVPAGLGTVTQVSAGHASTCVLKTSGIPSCWGDIEEYGGGLVDAATFLQVSPGGEHTCGVKSDGAIDCWGASLYGQTTVPAGLVTATQVTAADTHTCALTTAGTVACWGSNLWVYSNDCCSGKTDVPAGLGPVTQVVAAGERTCAVKSDGTLACWGDTRGQGFVPATLASVTQASLGDFHSCARHSDGTVTCWGSNHEGQATVPAGLSGVTQVSAGRFHTCALKSAGSVICWGANRRQVDYCSGFLCPLGDYVGQAAVPAGLSDVTEISTGAYHSCALRSDGAVICWGDDRWGESTVPAGLGSVKHLAAYRFSTCVVLATGAIECWGSQKTTTFNTPAGTNVEVHPLDQTTSTSGSVVLTFATVTQPGMTSVAWGTVDIGSAPRGFRVASASHALDIATTATFAGQVKVCVDYTGGDFGDETVLKLLHGDGAGNWTDITTSHETDNDRICGTVTSLSPFLLAEANAAPVVTSIALPARAVRVGTPTSIRARFTDANAADTHTATIRWENAPTPAAVDQAAATISATHTYETAGVYPIEVAVSDGDLGGARSSTLDDPAYIVVYDPSAGFVTGSGWFRSPASACPVLCGRGADRAKFSVEGRYHTAATKPDGKIHFDIGALRLTSKSYEWLVVSGNGAQLEGEGTINGRGSYGFLITAIDGRLKPATKEDRIRVQIWDRSRAPSDAGYIVYDNELGAAAVSASGTRLGGGNIVIHGR